MFAGLRWLFEILRMISFFKKIIFDLGVGALKIIFLKGLACGRREKQKEHR